MIFETSQAVLSAGEVYFLSISTNLLNLFLSIVGKFFLLSKVNLLYGGGGERNDENRICHPAETGVRPRHGG